MDGILSTRETYGAGQKTHYHPRLAQAQRWMQLVAGDGRTKTNHLFLVDISELLQTAGIPEAA